MIGLGLAGLALALQVVPLRPARLSLPPDSAAAVQSVKLRDGALHGRVFIPRESGPLPQVAVRLFRKADGAPGPMRPVKMTSAGGFSLPNVAPGSYVLEVWALGHEETRIALVAGSSGAVNALIRLTPEPLNLDEACAGNCPPEVELVVRGRIRCRGSSAGVPPELKVALADPEGGPPARVREVAPDGRFDIKAMRGTDWRIVVMQRDDLIESLPLRATRDTVRIDPLLISCAP